MITDSGERQIGPNGFPYSFSDLPPSRASAGLNTDTLNVRYPYNEILTHVDFRREFFFFFPMPSELRTRTI